MINVSDKFSAVMGERRDFRCGAEVTLAGGDTLRLTDADFSLSGNSITDAAGANTLPLGYAISRSVVIELINDAEQYAECDFFGARIRLWVELPLTGRSVERIEMGAFTVTEPETYGETVVITAVDDMYRADRPYSTALSFPTTAGAMFRDACERCGISFSTYVFHNSTFVVNAAPDGDHTYREIIGYIAMLAGGNARINRLGQCEILSYNFDKAAPGHELTEWINLRADTGDIVITGVQTAVTGGDDGAGGETIFKSGTDGYVISLDNPLFSGREQSAVDLIGEVLIGATLRRFECDMPAYPLAEFMDAVQITDRRGNTYRSVITDVNFVFFGVTTLSCSAESAVRTGSTYQSPIAGAITEARRLVARERTARETAQEELARKLAASSGLYSTEEEQPDGSTIYYLHDKPTAAESENVIRVGSLAIGFSTDGGQTYPYGLTIDGDVIARILSAEGINADWINAGTLSADLVHIGTKTVTQAISDTLSDAQNYTDEVAGEVAAVRETVTDLQVTQESISARVTQTEVAANAAKDAIDKLSVGGRNLLPGTRTMTGCAASSNVTFDENAYGTVTATFAPVPTAAWNQIGVRPPIPFSAVRNREVTFSFDARSDDWAAYNADMTHGFVVAFALYPENSLSRTLYTQKPLYTVPLSDGWQRISLTATLADSFFTSGSGTIDNTTRFAPNVYNYSVYSVQVRNFKLEAGNVATDWSPAPEDTDTAIDSLAGRVTQTESELTVQAGQIAAKVSRTDFDALSGRVSSAETSVAQQAGQIELKANASDVYNKAQTDSAITQKANEITARVTSVEGTANAAKNAVDDLSIGSTQLLRGTNTVTALTASGTWGAGTWRSASGGAGGRESITVTDAPNANVRIGWRLTETSGAVDIAQNAVPVAYGQTYTMSCYARAVSGTPSLRFQTWRAANVSHVKTVNITKTEWKRYSFTFTHDFADYRDSTNIYFGNGAAGTVEICGMKLEAGNVATDWSPAPEDTGAAIDSLAGRVTQTESELTVQAGQIAAKVSETQGSSESSFGWSLTASGWTLYSDGNAVLSADPSGLSVTGEINATSGNIEGGLIVDGTVTAGKISSGAVTADKLAASSVTAGKISSGAVTADKIAAGAITADKISAGAITADKLTVGNFNNLCAVDPDENNPYGAAVSTISGQKYFQFGNASKAGYYSLCLRRFPGGTTFSVGDEYLLRARGRHTGGVATNLVLRAYYASGEYDNLGSTAMAVPTSNGTITAQLKISSAPSGGVSEIRLCCETNAVSSGLVYIRDITVYQMGTAQLIVKGAVTADKISSGAVTADKISSGAVTADKISSGAVTAKKLSVGSLSAITADLGTVTAGTIRSTNYAADGTGSQIDLANGTINCSAMNAQGYLIGGSWGSGKFTTVLNDLGVCIISPWTYATGRYKAWIIATNGNGYLTATPAIYERSSNSWTVQETQAVTLASWSVASGGGTSKGGGGNPRSPQAFVIG